MTAPPSGDGWETDPSRESLGGRAGRGGLYMVAAQAARFVLQVGSTVVLARLLTPADFGVVGMVVAVTALADQLKEAGLSAAVVQRRAVTLQQVNALFWINVVVGAGLCLALAATAPALARFYGEEAVLPVALALSAVFFVSGFGVQHQALLMRRMRFGSLAARDVSAYVAGSAAGVVAAVLGAGVWALVVLQLVQALVRTLSVWVSCDWRPGRPTLRAPGLRGFITFGVDVTAFSVLNYLARNADNVLIGRYLGAAALGLYGRAYTLTLLPVQQITHAIAPVAVSALSRLQADNARYVEAYVRLLRPTTYAGISLTLLLLVAAPDGVPVVLGQAWVGAVPIFQVLAVAALAQVMSATTGWLYASSGRTRAQLYWGLVTRPLIVMAFVLGLALGGTARDVGLAYACVTALLLVPSMAVATRGTPVPPFAWARAVAVPLLAAAVVAGGCAAVALALREWEPGDRLVVLVATWAALFVVLGAVQRGLRDAVRTVMRRGL
ncbi:lipopolysaccharide biosynthesis protein [Aquipuribacter nitratireducens]|uniref:Lipopolysaccharide biosynthesis protein n=1 Tax=Aquipuribacter nitratireducens TaxID=650104 RepID=A0ABW0GPP2_9MICO